MAPRTHVTAVSQRPKDEAFCFFVKFYEPRQGTRILWTDSREYAEQFASTHRCYAKTAVVQELDVWARDRSIRFAERAVR